MISVCVLDLICFILYKHAQIPPSIINLSLYSALLEDTHKNLTKFPDVNTAELS